MEILTSREVASLVWLAIGLTWISRKVDVWGLVAGLFKSFFKPILIRAVSYMACYAGLSVWLLAHLGLWEVANLKTTILWFLGLALPWMMNVKRFDEAPAARLKSEFRNLLSITVLITFLTETYTFSIWRELVLIPLALAITLLHETSKGDDQLRIVEKFFGAIQTILGLCLLAYAAVQLAKGWAEFATMGTAREFMVTPLLSLLFLPLLPAMRP